jgi:hypothetical protein
VTSSHTRALLATRRTCLILNLVIGDPPASRYANGDRPKLLFAEDGVTPVAFTNAVGTGWGASGMDQDQTFTLLRPLARR